MSKKSNNNEETLARFVNTAVYALFEQHPNRSFNHKQVSKQIKETFRDFLIDQDALQSEDALYELLKNAVIESLHHLLLKEDLIEVSKGKFKLKPKHAYLEGNIEITSGGAAYLLSEDEEEEDEETEEGEERVEGEGRGDHEDGEGRGRRRRRRRRRGRGGDRERGFTDPDAPQPSDDGLLVVAEIGGDMTRRADDGDGEVDTNEAESFDADGNPVEGDPMRRRRRSRRGGRNRRRDGVERREQGDAPRAEFSEPDAPASVPAADTPVAPAWDWAPIAASAENKPDETKAAMPVESAPEPVRAEEPAPAPRPEPLPEAPVGPKRSGWWSRAKQSFGGN